MCATVCSAPDVALRSVDAHDPAVFGLVRADRRQRLELQDDRAEEVVEEVDVGPHELAAEQTA